MKDDNIDLSVLIPVYNSEKFIEECLESIVKNITDKIEIIILDDGSTDKSKIIYSRFSRMYSNIKVYQQSNKGIGHTRNKLIELSRGKYICFVDSDDLIDDKFYTRFYSTTYGKNIDLTIYGHLETASRRHQRYINKKLIKVNIKTEELIKYCFMYSYIPNYENINISSVWGKFFRKDLIINNRIRFPEDVKIGEDLLFMLDIYRNTQNIEVYANNVYIYRNDNQDSITNKYKPELFDEFQKFDIAYYKMFYNDNRYELYHDFYKLNDIILLMKFDWFNANNKSNDKIIKEQFLKYVDNTKHQEIYNRIKISGLLFNYPIEKRICFWAAAHKEYNLLKYIYKIRRLEIDKL